MSRVLGHPRLLDPRGAASRALGLISDEDYPQATLAALAAFDLGDEALYLAWELLRTAPSLNLAERRALLFLGLGVQVAVRQGSTRLPLSGEEGRAHFDELGRALGASEGDLGLARAMLGELREARLSGGSARLDPVAGLAGEHKPLLLDGYFLYAERWWRAEERLVATLGPRLRGARPGLAGDEAAHAALADVMLRPAFARGQAAQLTDEQEAAVRLALQRRLAVIVGGPGTGKTSIVAALLRCAARLGLAGEDLALAAPTGKAADRLRGAVVAALESVADPAEADRSLRLPAAQTLHRLLGYSPSGRFRQHENHRLIARLVVVDEASMLDLAMMDQLGRALSPDATLVLLGDADQLPSVDVGAVLRDLLPGEGEPGRAPSPDDARCGSVAVLRRSFRMSPEDPDGRRVLAAARSLQMGTVRLGDDEGAFVVRQSAADVQLAGAELLPATERAAFLARWSADLNDVDRDWQAQRPAGLPDRAALTRRVYPVEGGLVVDEGARAELGRLFADSERLRLLCVTRADAARVNAELHRDVLDRARAASFGSAELHGVAFYPGEPVLVQRNDYARGLYNGDQGLVIRAQDSNGDGHHFAVVFQRGREFQIFAVEAIRSLLRLAFAVTVHKSQGSEYDAIALLLPDEDLPLMTRELLYTAITRARRGALVVGSPEVLAAVAVRRVRRFSGLAAKLRRGG